MLTKEISLSVLPCFGCVGCRCVLRCCTSRNWRDDEITATASHRERAFDLIKKWESNGAFVFCHSYSSSHTQRSCRWCCCLCSTSFDSRYSLRYTTCVWWWKKLNFALDWLHANSLAHFLRAHDCVMWQHSNLIIAICETTAARWELVIDSRLRQNS